MSQNPPLSVSGDYPTQNYQQPPITASPGYPQPGQNYDNVDQNQRTWNQSMPSRPFNIPLVPLKVCRQIVEHLTFVKITYIYTNSTTEVQIIILQYILDGSFRS